MATYRIPSFQLEKFKERIAFLSKKAVKLVGLPITLEVLGTESVRRDAGLGGHTSIVNAPPQRASNSYDIFHTVEIVGPHPQILGWNILAVVDTIESEGVKAAIVRVHEGQDVPQDIRERAGLGDCDHCKTQRARKTLYILQKDGSADFICVGSTCVADFTGYKSPENLLKLFNVWNEVEQFYNDLEPINYTLKPDAVSLRGFMGYVAMVVRECGWVSRKTADLRGGASTSTLVNRYINEAAIPTAADVERGNKVIDFMMVFLDLEQENGELSDYLHNIQVLLHLGAVTGKTRAIATSILPVAEREMAKMAEKQLPNGHLGVLGQRLEVSGTVFKVKSMVTRYGPTFLVKVTTPQGKITFFNKTAVKEGIKVVVSGTVKQHENAYGSLETVLNRVKCNQVTESLNEA